MKKISINQLNIHKILPTIAVILIVIAQLLSTLLGIYLSTSQGFIVQIMFIVFLLLVININKKITINRLNLLVFCVIVIAFILTKLFVPEKCGLENYEFFIMIMVPFFTGMRTINYKKALEGVMLMTFFIIPVLNVVFIKSNMSSVYDAITMGTSYAILPVLCANILHFHYYRKESTIIQKISYGLSIIISFHFVFMSYRGALISLFLVIFFVVFDRIMNQKDNSLFQFKYILMVVIVLVLLVCALNFERIFISIAEILNEKDISIAFVDKYMYLMRTNDLSHGRENIFNISINGFFSSPLWGNGISTFRYNTGFAFPHNLVLQFLYDGGLMLAIPLIYSLIKGFIITFKKNSYVSSEKKIFILLLFFVSIPRMLVSAESWRIMPFWLMLSMINCHSNDENMRKADFYETKK